ncbi:MAG: hypothetical protein FWF81_04925 [Defluviitaleaceae bacterium]|nr:hypothetical protein [Defluviitaleaceae bacterium]
MNVNNANNPNYVPRYVTFRNETPTRNVHGDTNREIAERTLWLETNQRADPDGSLMRSHIMEINALRSANRGTGRSFGLNTPTQSSETLRSRQIDVIRELMAEQQEDSFKIDILQRMLEDAMTPPSQNTNSTRSLSVGGGLNVTI